MDPPLTRRQFLTATGACATTGLGGCALQELGDTTEPSTASSRAAQVPATVRLQPTVAGLDAPLAVAFAPDADRRYVAERDGRILLHGPDGLQDDLFLDLRETVETEGEKGLLGMALHPDFSDNRRLFVRYSAPLRAEMPNDYSHAFVLAEFEATADGTRARSDSEQTILEIPEPRPLHNGGDLAFGPDGYLYVSVGDSARSQNGQTVTENLLGSILRIDIDTQVDGRGYVVPDDNPLVGRVGLDEYYAWGFRNPWRLSFDGEDLYVADVGQSSYEEVNLVENGGNYGWDIKEGTHCFKTEECPDETPDQIRGGEPLLDPIIEYPHEGGPVSGVSIIGGSVYRGSAIPALEGRYVFGDFIPEGRLFVAGRPDNEDELWSTSAVGIDNDELLTRALSFGRDEDGEVYALGTGAEGGGLFKITPVEGLDQ